MRFKELQDAVLRQVRDASGHMRASVKEWINWTILDLAAKADWPWWSREADFVTDSFYSTGRASAKADQFAVSASGASWGKYVADSKISFSATAPSYALDWYRVASRQSATRVNLEGRYRGSSITRKNYVMWRDEYRLRFDVDRIKQIRSLNDPRKLVVFWPRELYDYDPNPARTGAPEIYRTIGTAKRSYYDTGSASFTANSRTIGGSAVVFDATMIGRSIRNVGDSRMYEINSSPSSSSVKLTTAYAGSSVGKCKFRVDEGVPMIQMYPIPDTKQRFVYEYQKIPTLLYADNDQPDIPERHQEVIIWGAIYRAHLQGATVESTVMQLAMQNYMQFIERNKSSNKQEHDRINRMGAWDRGPSRPQGGRFPGNYGYPTY